MSIKKRSKLYLEGLNADVLISGLACPNALNSNLLAQFYDFRTLTLANVLFERG